MAEHEKHHDSAHHEHHEHKEHLEKIGKGKIMGVESGSLILAISFLIIGLIVGSLVAFGAFSSTQLATQGATTGSGVDVDNLKLSVENYINTNLITDETVSANITDANNIGGGMYELSFEIIQDGEKVSEGTLFANSKKLIIPQATFDLTASPIVPEVSDQAEIQKSDTPQADLYIFSYCPAGTAALDSFAKAAPALKDSANFTVKFFSDMHGAHELQQNMTQECIQTVDKAKYWDYAVKYVTDIYPVCGITGSVDCDRNESVKLMDSLGIDSNAVLDCVATKGEELYNSDIAEATALQLQYSPSIVINGTYLANVDRTPEGIKNTVCSAFNTPPTDCNTMLSATGAAATGSCS